MTDGGYPTEPLPPQPQVAPTAPLPSIDEGARPSPPTSTRRRWPWVVAVILLVLALLVVGGEFAAKAYVQSRAKATFTDVQGLTFDGLTVDVADTPVIPSLVEGRLGSVRATAHSATVDPAELTGFQGIDGLADAEPIVVTDMALVANGVPIRGGDAHVGHARLDGTLPTDSVGQLAAAAGVPGRISIDTTGLTTQISVLGLTVSAKVDVKASGDCRGITWAMQKADIGDAQIPDGVMGLFGLKGREFTLSVPQLPEGVCLAGADLQDGGLRVTLTADDLDVSALRAGQTGQSE